jgi:hypothetical protein
MSVELFSCPAPAALPAITNDDCLATTGTINALGFQIYQATPSFTGSTILTQSAWTTALSATAPANIEVVRVINFQVAPGEFISEGGNDQTTFKGIPKIKARGFATATWMYEGITAATAKKINDFASVSKVSGGRTRLRVFLLSDENKIVHAVDFNGLEAYQVVIGDLSLEGYKNADMYAGQCFFAPGWSLDSVTSKAAFDVLALA